MEAEPDYILFWGNQKTKFYRLAREQFPSDSFPLETRLKGNIILELEHMDSPNNYRREPEYFVNLTMGSFETCLGSFKNEDTAKQRYQQCLDALKHGGRISLGVTDPQILDSNGNLVGKETYSKYAEDI